MRFSYDAARPGARSLASAFMQPTREASYDNELKTLANVDYLRSRMGKENAETDALKQHSDYIGDPTAFVASQAEVPEPLARRFADYRKTGDYGQIQPATPVDDEGNPNPVARITDTPAELAPFIQKLSQAFQSYGALRAGDKSNPEQIADTLGRYKGQAATAEVQDLVRSGKINDASALNQGSKLGGQIKMFDNIGNTGAVYSPGSGEVVAGKNSLMDAFIKNGAGKGSPYVYSIDENGNRVATFVPGGPADPATKNQKITDSERTTAGYANRMEEAEKLMETVPGGQTPGLTESSAAVIPGVGKMLSNIARTDDRQKYRQAQEDWVRSKLRKESGAVIADEEMDREIRVYFPQIGDSKAVIDQKKQARSVAVDAMRQAAGPAYAAPIPEKRGGTTIIRYDANGNRIK